jgi:hypothetical protein
MTTEPIRKFETGATRDTDKDKLDYEGFLSPAVIEAYAMYMHKHRFQRDGAMRNSDNWQNLFGPDHYAVCMKSLFRHFMDLWMYHRGLTPRETVDDAMAGIMFNVMAYWHKLLKERREAAGTPK